MSSQPADLTRAVVLVTGAGGGLGQAFALEFARRGAFVAVNDLGPAVAAATVRTIEDAGGTARAFVADVTDEQAVAAMVASIERDIGPLQVLVNNAGITRFEGDAFLDMSAWRRIMAVNLDAVWSCTREVLPDMLRLERKQSSTKPCPKPPTPNPLCSRNLLPSKPHRLHSSKPSRCRNRRI